jgi:hypothetical protein
MEAKFNKTADEQNESKQDNTERVTIFIYYNGDYVMKYENLSRSEADAFLRKYNSIQYPGWLAVEQFK